MPLAKPEDFGTAADGFRINDYCTYCFQNGSFTDPTISQEQMIERCVSAMARLRVMPEDKARALMTCVIPTLKRWRADNRVTASASGAHPAP
jgi:hypothetical protein